MIDQDDLTTSPSTEQSNSESESAGATWLPQQGKQTDPLVASILLPKKEEAPRARENAGALYAQETAAAESGFAVPATASVEMSTPVPVPPPTLEQKPPEELTVPKLQTYQGDIRSVVSGGDVSVVSIAAAEATRRAKSGRTAISEAPSTERSLLRTLMIAAGVLLLLGAIGGITYVTTINTSVPLPQDIPAPFISVDKTTLVPLSLETDPKSAVAQLQKVRSSSDLSLGLIERLLITVATTSNAAPQEMDGGTFLSILAPDAPDTLTRSISGQFLLGVHSFAENQPFLLFHVDSYEQAFSGMLGWESSMQQNLSTLFMHTPLKQLSSKKAAEPPQFLATPFVDAVIANHDTRVLQNDNGQILLLWTFLDRHTLLITTNDGTLREVITRLHTTPVSPTP